jgi:single-stranded DNA-binding protein
MNNKPKIKLTGQDGNVFNLIAIASRALKKSGKNKEADEMRKKIFACDSYSKAITIISEYCKIS